MNSPELFELVVRDNLAYVMRRQDGRLLGALTRLEAAALKMLAELTPTEQIKQIFSSVLPKEGETLVRRVEARFLPLLAPGRGIAAPTEFQELATVVTPDPKKRLRELPGPKVLHWWVTRYCPRKCVYCYAEPLHGGSAEDAAIARSELARIFEEAATLGAEHLVIAGAEPLLRSDLPEVMGDAIKHGLTPFLTTKHPISQQLALRFARAGVNHISLSVDCASPGQSLVLIGSKSYPTQIRRSVASLSQAGIQFSIQSVVTQLNEMEMWDVAELASELGATVMQVVPFETVRKPIAQYRNDELSVANVDTVRNTVERLASSFPKVRFEFFEKLGTGSRAQFHCDIGMTKLFFLPDGVVHRCYKLVDDLRLTGKDLKKCSVAEAWHDPGFAQIISPAASLYHISPCGKCGRFDNCHSEGRCIYESSVNHGTYFDQDRNCTGPFAVTGTDQLIPLHQFQILH